MKPIQVIIAVIFLVLGLWGSSFFFREVKDVIQATPPPAIVTDVVPTIVKPVIVNGAKTAQVYSQLASFKSKKQASAFIKTTGDKYGVLELRKVTLPNGTWYRVVTGVSSVLNGNDLCSKVKSSGGDCIVISFANNN